jgi:hypothetical protein
MVHALTIQLLIAFDTVAVRSRKGTAPVTRALSALASHPQPLEGCGPVTCLINCLKKLRSWGGKIEGRAM